VFLDPIFDGGAPQRPEEGLGCFGSRQFAAPDCDRLRMLVSAVGRPPIDLLPPNVSSDSPPQGFANRKNSHCVSMAPFKLQQLANPLNLEGFYGSLGSAIISVT
jgi:hypothetical protein